MDYKIINKKILYIIIRNYSINKGLLHLGLIDVTTLLYTIEIINLIYWIL